MNLLGALLIVLFGFLFVTVSSRLTGEIGSSSNPISGMTVATLLFTCLIFLLVGWTGGTLLRHGALGRRDRVHRGLERRHDLAGFEDRLPPRRHAEVPAVRDPRRGAAPRRSLLGPILLGLNDAATVYVPVAQVAPAGLHTDAGPLTKTETLGGPQARDDTNTYLVWQKIDDTGGPAGRYLVDHHGRRGLAGGSGHQRHAHRNGPTARRCGSSTRRRPP